MFERCMKNKCKTCPDAYTCDLIERFETKVVLSFKPFLDINEILERKKNGDKSRKRYIYF